MELINFNSITTVAIGVATVAISKKLYSYYRHTALISKIISDTTIYRPNPPALDLAMDLGADPLCRKICSIPVFNKIAKEWETASVYYREKDGEHQFAVMSTDEKTIGCMVVNKYGEMENGEFGCPALVVQMDTGYGNAEGPIPKIEIGVSAITHQSVTKMLVMGLLE